MDDNSNELDTSRADKIKAIRESVQQTAQADNWEEEIAERIARRESKATQGKITSESILEELDRRAAERPVQTADETPVSDTYHGTHEREPENVPEQQVYHGTHEREPENIPVQQVYHGTHEREPYENAAEQQVYHGTHEYQPQREALEKTRQYAYMQEDYHIVQEDSQQEEFPDSGEMPDESMPVKKPRKKFSEKVRGLFPYRTDSPLEWVRKIIFLGSCVAIVVCGYMIADYYIDNITTQNSYTELIQNYEKSMANTDVEETTAAEEEGEPMTLLPAAEELLAINSDVIGVINIPDTEVNYPVMQSNDLVKYLNLDFMGEEARAGALFMDYRNKFDYVVDGKRAAADSDNLVIYGHNMATGMMFGSLKNYREYDYYYGEHPIIELNSNYGCYKYKIFAFFILDVDDETETAFDCWNQLDFEDEDSFYDFVNEAKKRTLRLNDVDVQYGDKLLTLSTCNGIFGNDGPGRFIVMARRVRDGEDLYEGTQNSTANTNIKWPSLYYRYNTNESYDPDAEFVPYGPSQDTTGDE
jgi:sortase B